MALSIPGYRIKTELGRGGMARVYLAIQESLDREVALKVMSESLASNEEFCHRFLKEGRFVARLSHPHILTVHDIGESNGRYYMSTEYISGGSAADYLSSGITPERAVGVAKDVASALGAAHAKHIVHRDVKPSNILLREDGTCVLADFGIAKALDTTNTLATAPGFSVGTPIYMSPEQSRGEKLDGRCDIYSLGAVLFELLTGRRPYWSDNPLALALMHIKDPLPDLPSGLHPLQATVHKMLAKDRRDRYSTAAELIAALDKIVPLARALEAQGIKGDTPGDQTQPIARAPAPVSKGATTVRARAEPVQDSQATVAMNGATASPETGSQEKTQMRAATVAAPTASAQESKRGWFPKAAIGVAMVVMGVTGVVYWPVSTPPLSRAELVKLDTNELIAQARRLDSSLDREPTARADLDTVLSVLDGRVIGLMTTGKVSAAKVIAQEVTTVLPEYESIAMKQALDAIVGGARPPLPGLRPINSPTRKAPAGSPADIPGLLAMGRAYLQQGSLTSPSGANAWETFQRVLDIDPENGPARAGQDEVLNNYLAGARVLRKQGRIQSALEAVQTGLDVAPDDPELLNLQDQLQQQLLHPNGAQSVPEGSQ